jgi:putative transcriptional regulator
MRNRLKVLRAERNWSQTDLGERVGVSRQAVTAIETGKYDPSLPLALRLARLFEQPVEAIFFLDEVESEGPTAGFSQPEEEDVRSLRERSS